MRTDSIPNIPPRAPRLPRARRRVLPVLGLLTLLCGLLLAAGAYAGARIAATDAAVSQAAKDAQVARRVLDERARTLAISGGALVARDGATTLTLNGDTTLVDAMQTLTGDDVSIYALQGGALVDVATTRPLLDSQGAPIAGARALGDLPPSRAQAALLGTCMAAACSLEFAGVVSAAGTDIVAAFTPLFDTTGALVGALGVARPFAVVLAPVQRLGEALLAAALLLTVLALLVGARLTRPRPNTALESLGERLHAVAATAADVEHLLREQVTRAHRQEQVGRQVSEAARALDALLEVVEQGWAALRDSTAELTAGNSTPGQAPNAATAARLARQAGMSAGRIGAATDELRERCRALRSLANAVIAEGHALGDGGQRTERRAGELRTAIERVELALGARLVTRHYDLPGNPFARRVRTISRRLSRRRGRAGQPAPARPRAAGPSAPGGAWAPGSAMALPLAPLPAEGDLVPRHPSPSRPRALPGALPGAAFAGPSGGWSIAGPAEATLPLFPGSTISARKTQPLP